jgi:hypothetical protein
VGGVLQFNGRSANENSPNQFRAVDITSSALAPETPDYSAAIRLLEDFSPHVIIAAASDEFLTAMIPALESQASGIEPFYLLSPWHYGSLRLPWLTERYPRLYARIAGVNWAAAPDQTIYDGYQARFDAAYPAFAGTRGNENYYDAAYYLVHAAAAAGTVTPLLGSNLVYGMRRLLSGRLEFSVGPSDLLPAFLALEVPGTSIVLNGAMGPPNFDPRTGARNEPGSVWCVDVKGTVHADVLRLDSDATLVGRFPCFDFGDP